MRRRFARWVLNSRCFLTPHSFCCLCLALHSLFRLRCNVSCLMCWFGRCGSSLLLEPWSTTNQRNPLPPSVCYSFGVSFLYCWGTLSALAGFDGRVFSLLSRPAVPQPWLSSSEVKEGNICSCKALGEYWRVLGVLGGGLGHPRVVLKGS